MEGFSLYSFLARKTHVRKTAQTLENQGFNEKKSRFLPTRFGEERIFSSAYVCSFMLRNRMIEVLGSSV